MRVVVLGLSVGLLLGFSAPAHASAASEAVLAAPLTKPKMVVVDGKVWTCRGAACTSRNAGLDQTARRECVRLGRRLGRFAAYVRNGIALDAAQLAACNRARPASRPAR